MKFSFPANILDVDFSRSKSIIKFLKYFHYNYEKLPGLFKSITI
jgi:hypothetical protein